VPRSDLPTLWTPPVARRQSGLFTAQQALAAGAPPDLVRYRRRSGRWIRIAGDALALAGTAPTALLRVQAAGLTWPEAVVCHQAAAVVHRLPVPEPDQIDVIVAHRHASRAGLRTHVVGLRRDEVTVFGTARVTTLSRTIADCIGRLSPDLADGVLSWALTRGLADADDLRRMVDERTGSWGNRRRRRAYDLAADGAASVAEQRLHRMLRRAGLTGWEPNAPVRVRGQVIARADVLFPEVRLVIEVDGRRYHGADRFQLDRDRDNVLVSAGYTVLRFTWHDLTARPQATLSLLVTTLARLGQR
jgi:very-short-patch-repair endonuclease